MNNFRLVIRFLVLLGISSTVLGQDCGEVPVNPEVVDGTSVTMDGLIENSVAVKSFIADADIYLDCSFAYRDTVEYKDLGRRAKLSIVETAENLLDDRNDLGDEFNEQVMAYQTANPE